MGWWRTFLDSLASEGGQVFLIVSLIVFSFCMLFHEPAAMKAGELLSLATGALFMKFKSADSNRTAAGSTTTQIASVSETPPAP